MHKKVKIFIIIPLYNEEKHISGVLRDVSKYRYPILVINDGSADNSIRKITGSNLKGIAVLEHKVNLGKGAAMKTGAEYAFGKGADGVIFMDSDGQHAAADIPKFVKALEENYQVVFGSRNLNLNLPLVRYFGNKAASVLVNLLFGIYVSDLVCGFRALSKEGYKAVRWESPGYGVETEMVIRSAKKRVKTCEVPVETIYHNRVKGVTIVDAFGIFFSVLKWRLRI